MKRVLTICIIVFFSLAASARTEESAFKEIASEISGVTAKMKNGTVAVFPFEAVGFADSNYGIYTADKISAALSKHKDITLVEREKLSGIMKEKELSMLGVAEQDEARKIGSLLSVDAVIVGRAYRTETGSDITVKVIDTLSGKVLSVINLHYEYTSKLSGDKKHSGFIGTWEVKTTAPYLTEQDMRYEKIILRNDNSFSLFLTNNDGRYVEIRGNYRIEKNNINYRPMQMYFDENLTSFKRSARELEGTIYIVEGKLYFNYTGIYKQQKSRLDAMNIQYRCVAERSE